MKPRVFIGSTAEAEKFAGAVVAQLSSVAVCRPWDQGVFEVGGVMQESLVRGILECDYAIIILSLDDTTGSRGVDYFSPRDNLIFEAGISFGALHPSRTFLIPEARSGAKLPSDLNGFTITSPFNRQDAPEDAVRQAVTQISKRVQELGLKPTQHYHGSHEHLARAANELLAAAGHTIVLFGRDLSWASRYVETIKQKVLDGVTVEVFSDRESRKKAQANAKLLTDVGAKIYYCEQDTRMKLTLVDHGSDAVSQFMISFKERNPSHSTNHIGGDQFMYRYTIHDARSSLPLWLTLVRLYESFKGEVTKVRRTRTTNRGRMSRHKS